MPGITKHVRFANFRTEYPAEPYSPAYTSSSVPSSNGPVTPPQHQSFLPGHLPYHIPAPTKPAMQPPRAHNLLAYSRKLELIFDVTLPTSALRARYQPLSGRALTEPAVSPPVSSLVLTTHLLPWSITVVASNRYFVTVRDVLDGIYYALRTNVSHREYNSIPNREDQKQVDKAYESRYRRMRDRYAYIEEKKSGVRRVDFLRGRTQFMGITPSKRSGTWGLHLDYY